MLKSWWPRHLKVCSTTWEAMLSSLIASGTGCIGYPGLSAARDNHKFAAGSACLRHRKVCMANVDSYLQDELVSSGSPAHCTFKMLAVFLSSKFSSADCPALRSWSDILYKQRKQNHN